MAGVGPAGDREECEFVRFGCGNDSVLSYSNERRVGKRHDRRWGVPGNFQSW
jgi:hypothetical protein